MQAFPLDQLGNVGIIKDIPPHACPIGAWTDGENVRFVDGTLQQAQGFVELLDLSSYISALYALQYVRSSLYDWWIGIGTFGSSHRFWGWRLGSTNRDMSPASGLSITAGDRWTGGDLNGTPILHNGRTASNTSKGWYIPNLDTTGVAVELPYSSGVGLSTKLKFNAIRPWRTHLIGLGTEVVDTTVDEVSQGYYPQLLWWSDSSEPGQVPGSWEASDPTTLSRFTPDPFSRTSGELVDAVGLGPQIVVYKSDSCYIGQYVGGNLVIQFDDMLKTVGALSQNCAVELLGQHVVLSDGDVVMHGVGGAQSILDRKLRRTLFNSIDVTNYKRSFVLLSPNSKEVWICYPETNQSWPNMAVVWNYQDNTTTLREIHSNCTFGGLARQTASPAGDEYSPAVHTLFTTKLSGELYQHNIGETFDGANPLCFVEKKGIVIGGDTSYRKIVNGLWLDIDGDGSAIDVYVGNHDRTDQEPPEYEDPVSFVPGTTDYVPVLTQGRLFAIKLRWQNGAEIKINRITLDWAPAGRF